MKGHFLITREAKNKGKYLAVKKHMAQNCWANNLKTEYRSTQFMQKLEGRVPKKGKYYSREGENQEWETWRKSLAVRCRIHSSLTLTESVTETEPPDHQTSRPSCLSCFQMLPKLRQYLCQAPSYTTHQSQWNTNAKLQLDTDDTSMWCLGTI